MCDGGGYSEDRDWLWQPFWSMFMVRLSLSLFSNPCKYPVRQLI